MQNSGFYLLLKKHEFISNSNMPPGRDLNIFPTFPFAWLTCIPNSFFIDYAIKWHLQKQLTCGKNWMKVILKQKLEPSTCPIHHKFHFWNYTQWNPFWHYLRGIKLHVLNGLTVFIHTLATCDSVSFVSLYDTQYRCKSMTSTMLTYHILYSFC